MKTPRLCTAFASVCLAVSGPGIAHSAPQSMTPTLDWKKLTPIPDAEGFAAPFAGISNGALIVAGGANIIGDRWKDPFEKKWYATTFVLEHPEGKWIKAAPMPHPLAYGVSITTEDGVVCIGGSDESRHFSDVFLLKWKDGRLTSTPLPSLPEACANASGAAIGTTLYVAGGLHGPDDTAAMHTFWALDLSAPEAGWRELEPWPGPARMFAVVAVRDGSLFLFSGAGLHADAEGKPQREYLRDAYRFTPGKGWKRLADLPRPANAAPSPALTCGKSAIAIISGSDGKSFAPLPPERHPGFPRDVLIYDTAADSWSTTEQSPASLATVPAVRWGDRFVIPGGEVRPRVRTPEVWSVTCEE